MKNLKRIKKNNFRALRDRGAAVITAILFFVIVSVTIAVSLASPVVNEYQTVRDFEKSKGSYYLSEAGQEDAIYRIKKLLSLSSQEIIVLNGNTATTTITTVNENQKTVDSLSNVAGNIRRVKSTMTTAIGESFTYGVWVGNGGVRLRDSSSITGNLFSSGLICGNGTSGENCNTTSSEHDNPYGVNTVTGTVISSGFSGTNGVINRVKNQDSAPMYAYTIKNSQNSGLAYCHTISGSSTSTCQSLPTITPADLPITAAEIANWESVATAGGSATCTSYWDDGHLKWRYQITSSTNLGPKKIPCDLDIYGGSDSAHRITVTLQGPVWVDGDIDIRNYATVRIDPVYVGQSIVLVADKTSDREHYGQIDIHDNHTLFTGAPGGDSWVMLISENDSASRGGETDAIDVEQGADGDLLLYARLGDVRIGGDADINQVTSYKLTLEDTANVTYSTGLQNALFVSGPSGAWSVQNWGDNEN